jgi:hypothetical protein
VDPDPGIDPCDKWIQILILDLDPGIFVTDLQEARQKQIFNNISFVS